ncbi:aminotransferase class III-fold pyridoxal phosphate-dependent enzyme [Roseateles sp. SL47]|uniref:aspartate aminotransferase family protein n=1 Tax=Roseateles sp. SL47 TaxID=2995138 RepID=UPI002270DA82|nr:aminotransferase class III-fold pyridoxal phosphate-dependent enzyme [Roseateles sp. SL47]WAC71667.1 aminotransferase class III-fold pyridoxal phosphate-dependent enzyme [Roseateles sp. SL47]
MNTLTSTSLPDASAATEKARSAFADRYGSVFGRQQGLMLKMAGLASAECGASGPWVVDSTHRRWLDFGSFGVHLLGHRHPEVVRALMEQVQQLGLSTKILANEPIVRAAERLRQLARQVHEQMDHRLQALGAPPDNVIFANSGAEAVEAGLKLARIATGRRRILAFRHAYHGRTAGALSVSHGYLHHAGLMTDGQATFVEVGDHAAVHAALSGGEFAAVIIEPVQGEGGIRPVDPSFLEFLRSESRRHDVRLLLDEIQTGLGRAGSLLCPVPADIRLLGKVLGGGMFPVAAALVDTTRFGAAARDPVVHASSFAGSALAGAVINAVLDVVTADSFLPRIRHLERLCRDHLLDPLRSHGAISAVRGDGLMLGLEFKEVSHAGELVIEAAKRGLLLAFCLTAPRVIRLYPPATIEDHDLIDGLARLRAGVDALPSLSQGSLQHA